MQNIYISLLIAFFIIIPRLLFIFHFILYSYIYTYVVLLQLYIYNLYLLQLFFPFYPLKFLYCALFMHWLCFRSAVLLSVRCPWNVVTFTSFVQICIVVNVFSEVQEPGQIRGRPKYPTYQNFKGRKSNSLMNLCGKLRRDIRRLYHMSFSLLGVYDSLLVFFIFFFFYSYSLVLAFGIGVG